MGNKVVVIGGGPGGYVAAIRASQLNNEVILIEKDELGGVCLNRGCITMRTLAHSANTFWQARNSDSLGIHITEISLDVPLVIARKHKVVTQLVNGVHSLMKKNRVRVISGVATIIDPRKVGVIGQSEAISTDNIVVATGSVPSSIAVEGISSNGVIDTNEALEMQELPKSMAIIGGGVIGIEFAQMMHRMGVDVIVLEMMPQILPTEDVDLAQLLENILVQEGVEIFTSATVNRISATHDGGTKVSFTTKAGDSEELFDKVLVAVGRKAETSHLGLERLGIELDKGCLVVNERMQTSIPGIYAVGDVVGGTMLAHLASAQGKCAAENISGICAEMHYRAVPRCIYTSPEVACVGLTEAQARAEHGGDVIVGGFPFVGNGKAVILGQTDGVVKVIAEAKYGEVLGIEILGPCATELIGEAVLGIGLEATYKSFAAVIHAHPTLSEGIMEAALHVDGKAIHI